MTQQTNLHFLAGLLNQVSDAIISTDLDYCIQSWNKAASDIYGLSLEEVLGRPGSQVFHYRYKNSSSERARHILATEGSWKGEVVFTRKDGNEIYLQASITTVRDDTGKATGYVAVNRDITAERLREQSAQAQKLSEMQLAHSQVQFKSFMENTPALALIVDETGRIEYMNSRFMAHHNVDESAIGKTVYDVLPEIYASSLMANNRKVLQSNATIEVIEETPRRDSTIGMYQVFKFPIQSIGPKRLVGSKALDITQQLSTRIDLIRSNERYHYSSKATSDAIWDWEIEENRIYRGEGYRTLFGYTAMVDSFTFQLEHIHEQDRDAVRKSVEEVLNSHSQYWKKEYRFRCADGSYRLVLDKGFILRSVDGTAYRMIGAMQDITEQRKLEERLVAEESLRKRVLIQAIMKAQDKEREDISSELHDNVNQILSTCSLYLEVAQSETDPLPYIHQCYENLQLAIVEIRRISHNLNPSSLQDIGLFAAIGQLADQINASGKISMTLYCADVNEDSIPAEIRLGIYRIVQEQVNNILRHAQASMIELRGNVAEGILNLVIQDNGKGFNPAKTKKGLGLNSIINRAEFFRGTATIQSTPGKGCTLYLKIPVDVPKAADEV